MSAFTLRFRLALIVCLILGCTAHASQLARIHTDDGALIEVTGLSPHPLANGGYAPLKVQINNPTAAARTWKITGTSPNYQHSDDGILSTWEQSLSVPAGQSRTFELLPPLLYKGKALTGYEFALTGPGIRGRRTFNLYSVANPWRSEPFVYGLASDSLRTEHGGRLSEFFEDHNYCLVTSASEGFGFYPTDWRGYLGLHLIWFQQADWEKLQPAQQRAILQWVFQGGKLRIVRDKGVADNTPVAGIPVANRDADGYGAGSIRLYPHLSAEELAQYDADVLENADKTQGKSPYSERVKAIYAQRPGDNFWLPGKAAAGDVLSHPENDAAALVAASRYPDELAAFSSNDIFNVYPPLYPNLLVLGLTILAIGIIIGPLNLWVFARGRRRYRLLLTTPLISLGCCVVIAGVALFGDGIGGEGVYSRLFILDGSNQQLTFETQNSRTGLLLGREFTPEAGTVVVPLNDTGHRHYRQSNGVFTDGWFSSRSVRKQMVTSLRPSRAAFEVRKNADGYTLLSSFPATCPEVYLTGPDGQTWYVAKNVSPGRPAQMLPAERSEFIRWKYDTLVRVGIGATSRIGDMNVLPGHIYASVENYTGEEAPRIGSIHWKPYTQMVIAPARFEKENTKEAGK